MAIPTQQVALPPKLAPLFEPKRYKVLYGGRGGSKSWGIARALLVLGSKKPMRILCARELQNSIKDSVHRLLSDQIDQLNLGSFYEVGQQTIRANNGTEFFFEGIKQNVNKLKSYEGIDVSWVEEGHMVSKNSWDILIPTIRKEGSEIWISFNPELEDDETYQRFVVHPPKDSVVIKMDWRDNPWFPEVLRKEMEELKERDYQAYLTVWEGQCRKVVEGAIFANEIEACEITQRITTVPYDKSYSVTVAWDLGWADFTALWFMQRVGERVHLIDYYENQFQEISHYVAILGEKGYVYTEDLLPHDAAKTELGSGKSVAEILDSLGRKKQRIIPRLSKKEQIDTARRFFPRCYFDLEHCGQGISHLRRYRYQYNDQSGVYSREPFHDQASHASDSFIYLACGYQENRALPYRPGSSILEKRIRENRNRAVIY